MPSLPCRCIGRQSFRELGGAGLEALPAGPRQRRRRGWARNTLLRRCPTSSGLRRQDHNGDRVGLLNHLPAMSREAKPLGQLARRDEVGAFYWTA